jgi:hypothetical protein
MTSHGTLRAILAKLTVNSDPRNLILLTGYRCYNQNHVPYILASPAMTRQRSPCGIFEALRLTLLRTRRIVIS